MKQTPPKIIFWIIWIAFFSALFFYRQFLGTENPESEEPINAFMWVMLIVPTLLTVVLRWIVLAKIKTIEAMLPIFIAGIALSESLTFFGIFLFPSFQDLFLIVSILATIQYFPLFLKFPVSAEPKDA